jgi:hypothetical protein
LFEIASCDFKRASRRHVSGATRTDVGSRGATLTRALAEMIVASTCASSALVHPNGEDCSSNR